MSLGPLKFTPIFKEKIWGGDRLRVVAGKDIPAGSKIGESWEISDHVGDLSIVSEGPHAGKSLRDLMLEHRDELLGQVKPEVGDRFPLLLKLLDANDVLSVQVHPDDAYAREHENGDPGKTEAWFILHAEPGSRMIHGLKQGVTRTQFEELLRAGRLAECLRSVPVSPGDVLFCPSGTVHAIGAGIALVELQQNSDTTYRAFDWNRVGLDGKPRDLHIDRALAVTNFGPQPKPKESARAIPDARCAAQRLVTCEKFIMEQWSAEKPAAVQRKPDRFDIFYAVEGEAEIAANNGESAAIRRGEFVLVPAACAEYSITPADSLRLLRATGP